MNPMTITIFHALADPTRQKILKLLSTKEASVTEICGYFPITQPSISHHLGILKKNGLVKAKKQGRSVYYATSEENFSKYGVAFLRDIGFIK